LQGLNKDIQLPVANDFLLNVQSWHLTFWKFLLVIYEAVDMEKSYANIKIMTNKWFQIWHFSIIFCLACSARE